MFATAMTELLVKFRLTDATTPSEYAARVEIIEADVRQQWEAIGFENGKAAGLRQAAPFDGQVD
jgi:hypothetical protein